MRPGLNLIEGEVHCSPGGLADVDAIDHLHINSCNRVTNPRGRGEHGKKCFALFFRKLFGIVQPAETGIEPGFQPGGRENDRGGDYRARQGPTTCLVYTCNQIKALSPQLLLMR